MSNDREVFMADATEFRPFVEIEALGIKDSLAIYNDKEAMTNELRRIAERLAFGAATEYGADKALIMCVLFIDEDIIGAHIVAMSTTHPERNAMCAFFALGPAVEALKQHDKLSVNVSFTKDRSTPAANQSEQS